MFYKKCPETLEMIDVDHYKYRWNVQFDNSTNTWFCNEVVIEQPINYSNITKKVLESVWPIDEQLKMINDYNTILEDICSEEGREEVLLKYRQFLIDRLAIKAKIRKDLLQYGIES